MFHLTVFEVEAMEVQALHQVSQGLGLKRCNAGITHLPAHKHHLLDHSQHKQWFKYTNIQNYLK